MNRAWRQHTQRELMQRIRAGWLPHRVGDSWWWGRPATDDGFRLWSDGTVPSMSVVERMTSEEVSVWNASLHPAAPERDQQLDESEFEPIVAAGRSALTSASVPYLLVAGWLTGFTFALAGLEALAG